MVRLAGLALLSARTTLWALAGVLLSLVSGIISARMLGPSDRGTLAIVLTVVGLTALFGALGTNVSLRVFLPSDSRVTLTVFRRLSMKLVFVNLVLCLIAMMILSRTVDARLTNMEIVGGIALLAVATFTSTQVLDCFNAVHASARSAQLNAGGFLITAVLLGAVWVSGGGLLGGLLAYFGGFAARSGAGIWLLFRSSSVHDSPARPGGQRLLLINGVPLLGMNVGQALMLRSDQLLVGVLAGTQAAGLYAVATIPAGILTVISNSVGQVTFAEAAYGRLTYSRLLRQTLLALASTLGVAGIGFLLVPWLVPVLFGVDFIGAVGVAQVLLLAQVLLAPYLVLSRAMAGYGLVKWAGYSGLAGVPVLMVSAIALLPTYGLMGAGLAATVAFLFLSSVTMVGLILNRPWAQSNL